MIFGPLKRIGSVLLEVAFLTCQADILYGVRASARQWLDVVDVVLRFSAVAYLALACVAFAALLCKQIRDVLLIEGAAGCGLSGAALAGSDSAILAHLIYVVIVVALIGVKVALLKGGVFCASRRPPFTLVLANPLRMILYPFISCLSQSISVALLGLRVCREPLIRGGLTLGPVGRIVLFSISFPSVHLGSELRVQSIYALLVSQFFSVPLKVAMGNLFFGEQSARLARSAVCRLRGIVRMHCELLESLLCRAARNVEFRVAHNYFTPTDPWRSHLCGTAL